MLIEALPPILVLHIKRFHYDTTVGGVVKIAKHVRYSPELEIPSGKREILCSNLNTDVVVLQILWFRLPGRHNLHVINFLEVRANSLCLLA